MYFTYMTTDDYQSNFCNFFVAMKQEAKQVLRQLEISQVINYQISK